MAQNISTELEYYLTCCATGSPGTLFSSYTTGDASTKVDVIGYPAGCYIWRVGGTSQAAFHLSALMAIYKQKYPSLNQEGARNLLRRKALKMDGYTYSVSSSTKDTLLNYETGAGFTAPLY